MRFSATRLRKANNRVLGQEIADRTGLRFLFVKFYGSFVANRGKK
ncbi:hypothetical protein HMPREF7215_1165 [Pyramidobacter piscolens W5455]|uniref:Uncharacterized protein n=1 Tax=Pyramidobacter piscolens W5455 TaxID=352165 RepID=A0ABP2HU60_9BACT|nr:hypothetical protein HMPREF7215_1165 [Pyramidobacter piscolens W5455]